MSSAENTYGGKSNEKASTTYDAAVKKLLSNKPFLAHIMKACMPEYREATVEEIAERYIEGNPCYNKICVDEDQTIPSLKQVDNNDMSIEGLNNESSTMTEGSIRYDIRFNALVPKDNGLVGVIVNVEAQNDSDLDYPILKRAIYYCSRMISAQKNTVFKKSEYDKIKKVYSIWVLADAEKGKENTIMTYNITEQALKGSAKDEKKSYDLLCAVIIRLSSLPIFKDGSVDEELLDHDVIGMLDVLLKGSIPVSERKSLLQKHYGIQMTEIIEEEVGQMCNLSKGILNQGIAIGKEEGLKQGIERGIEQGIEQGIERGIEQGIERGIEQGIKQERKEMITEMIKDGMSTSKIMRVSKQSKAFIEDIRAKIASSSN